MKILLASAAIVWGVTLAASIGWKLQQSEDGPRSVSSGNHTAGQPALAYAAADSSDRNAAIEEIAKALRAHVDKIETGASTAQ
jgi:hypothetical protein